ncbi:DUF4446 family protein [Desulfosporosinus nitroreducens]|uniref:DUF4446 family protein n=1 Tax=Desulfosporosinus nitroreducens TaxID=2018668 RepID=A0ABT8QRM0_9FIRM|nr:DUF4446 family protein [Desulfosporosinus nitroreducens]MCO1601428.1 DUF4446 family protein [Desulfosporosinus nitroreducens]MDO0824008.1 DUF4446 family protein [Desulfosporosinus nitroreducens]
MPLYWWAVSVLAFLLLIVFILSIALYRRMKRFEGSYISLQTFMNGQQMDALLNEYVHKVTEIEENVNSCNERLTPIELKLRASIDRAELLRFRAFEDVGSDLSFAVAFLNQDCNGLVISSIYSREEARIYAKPINGGQSVYSLSDEEKEVISKAMIGQQKV